MDQTLIIVILGLLGLCFGSFVNALVWRLHKGRDFVAERSECTHCHHVLAWYDLVPVLSWVALRGRCRYCHKKIDDSPIVELGVAVLFVVSYLFWPFTPWTTLTMSMFAIWLVSLVILAALTLYDLKWQLLLDKLVFPLIGLGIVLGWLRFYGYEVLGVVGALLQMIAGVAIISGLYLALHLISHGRWVGFGDVKLNVFIGLILGWQGALLALFMANLLGVIVVLPGLVMQKITPRSRIPFGPFLIAACIITLLFGRYIIDWYMHSLLGL